MDGNIASTLETTNLMIGIIAVVNVFFALVVIGAGIWAFATYRKVSRALTVIEQEQIAPLRAQVDRILVDVSSMTARLSHQTERVDQAISGTMDRVDDTAERVKTTVREKVNQATGVVRGVRAVIASLLNGHSGPKSSAPAAGRV
jgi:hypothetical protein